MRRYVLKANLTDMKLSKIRYEDLNSRQKEIFNFHKVSSNLVEYGFNCIKLSDDWQGADFLAYHKDGEDTLRVQLKARLTIDKKYLNKNIYITFPVNDSWCLIKHDDLVKFVEDNTNWKNTDSWIKKGLYHSANPSKRLLGAIKEYIL